MKKPAVFLDRDGTINEQMGYINHLSRFVLIKGVSKAIKILNENGFLAIVLTNQSGVARGYFPIDLVYQINEYLSEELEKENARIDGVFFCPHYPKGSLLEYCFECDCRKPRTGLIRQACSAFDIDMKRSYMVGDRHTDIEFAHHCGMEGVLVKTGYGVGEVEYILPGREIQPTYIADDLQDAVKWILNKEKTKV